TMNTLGANGSGTTSYGYTFPSGGTWYIRICADLNTGNVGSISESDEGDNCGAWTAITVGGGAPDVTFGTNATIAPGGSAPLTWSSTGATSCTGSGFVTGGVVAGTVSVSPGATTSYGLSCTGTGGTTNASPVTITVSGSVCSDTGTVDIAARPTRIVAGDTTTLTWTASDTSGVCSITGPGVSEVATPNSCSVSGSITTPPIGSQATYIISCPGGRTDSVIVNVVPKFEEF
ncbi:MAG: hypothetical protein AAB901_02185, partial [Patescibacteria group bacterium]